jgi:16S rRNA (adenine1518-N6/adenine1519-N6)-dimethyltransferase
VNEDFRFPRIGDLLRRLDVRLSKHKSQHFLKNHGVCEQIAKHCHLTERHVALEIGAGLGNLSVELARHAGQVLSVEMDDAFVDWHGELESRFPNLEIRRGDFLKVDLEEAMAPFADRPKVAVGNLPYQITAPILFRLIASPIPWERIVVMVQREVADRMVLGPGDRQASALTYKLALSYHCEMVMRLPPGEFLPPPKVNSAVVVLTPLRQAMVQDRPERDRAHAIITGIFQYRRKTLANALVLSGLAPKRDAAEEWIRSSGLDPMRRPDSLTLEEIVALTRQRPASGAGA